MKKLFLSLFGVLLFNLIMGQSGTTCTNAIALSNGTLCPLMQASSNQIIWHKFTADSSNVLISCSVKQDSLNPLNYIEKAELYSGSCNSLNLIYSELSASNEQKNISINASGLVVGNEYYVKIYNSSLAF